MVPPKEWRDAQLKLEPVLHWRYLDRQIWAEAGAPLSQARAACPPDFKYRYRLHVSVSVGGLAARTHAAEHDYRNPQTDPAVESHAERIPVGCSLLSATIKRACSYRLCRAER